MSREKSDQMASEPAVPTQGEETEPSQWQLVNETAKRLSIMRNGRRHNLLRLGGGRSVGNRWVDNPYV